MEFQKISRPWGLGSGAEKLVLSHLEAQKTYQAARHNVYHVEIMYIM